MRTAAEILAKNLRSWRKTKGWSQERLAEHADISMRGVQDIEGCISWPESKTVTAIAKAFGIDNESLLFAEAYDLPPPSMDDALDVLQKFMKSLTPARRRLLAATATLDDAEITAWATMIEDESAVLAEPRKDNQAVNTSQKTRKRRS